MNDLAVAVYVIVRNDDKNTLIYRDKYILNKWYLMYHPILSLNIYWTTGGGTVSCMLGKLRIDCFFLGVKTGVFEQLVLARVGLSKEGVNKSGVGKSVNESYRRCVNGDLNTPNRDKAGGGKKKSHGYGPTIYWGRCTIVIQNLWLEGEEKYSFHDARRKCQIWCITNHNRLVVLS